MKIKLYPKFMTAAILAALLSGCADLSVLDPQPDESRFFVLGAAAGPAMPGPAMPGPAQDGPTVLVGPGSLAKYLDRPNIASYTGAHTVEYSGRNRWAEPLEESITRLLAGRITGSGAGFRTGSLRMAAQLEWDYRVGFHVEELCGELGESVSFKVTWWISRKDGTAERFENSRYETAVPGGGDAYTAYVTAMETALDKWMDEVMMALEASGSG